MHRTINREGLSAFPRVTILYTMRKSWDWMEKRKKKGRILLNTNPVCVDMRTLVYASPCVVRHRKNWLRAALDYRESQLLELDRADNRFHRLCLSAYSFHAILPSHSLILLYKLAKSFIKRARHKRYIQATAKYKLIDKTFYRHVLATLQLLYLWTILL